VGGVETVLIDTVDPVEVAGERHAVGRTARDAPEVDGRVIIELAAGMPVAAAPAPGDFVEIRVTGVQGYDLAGSLVA
jgi:ribosomal protein S12 methylthiotransferase